MCVHTIFLYLPPSLNSYQFSLFLQPLLHKTNVAKRTEKEKAHLFVLFIYLQKRHM